MSPSLSSTGSPGVHGSGQHGVSHASHGPPQSTSVSSWFWMPSSQDCSGGGVDGGGGDGGGGGLGGDGGGLGRRSDHV